MSEFSVTVLIPTYHPDERFRKLLHRLKHQTKKPDRILILNTEREFFPADLEADTGIEIQHIRKAEFDHGGTRDLGARMADTDLILFMTMDAIPADRHLIQTLSDAFENPKVAAAYARQLPCRDCSPLERFTRSFNYGEQSRIKTGADLEELGIKTFFCSDVCAAYRRSAYLACGGFERKTIFNEDMIFAGKLIRKGMAIAYCADARVIHSHNYSGLQQLHRNFDLGVSQAQHPEVFAGVKSESEGIRMVKQTALWLVHNGMAGLLPKLFWQSGCKYMGYRLGTHYQRLPSWMIAYCTMNPTYWK